jgi:1-acyl-sn-glycerol-3-phosphate acyltransferase
MTARRSSAWFSSVRSAALWIVSAGLVALWSAFVAAVWVCERDPLKRRTGRAFRSLGVALTRVHRARLDFQHAEPPDRRRTYVVVSNHQSLADIPVLCHLPWEMKWIAKAELFRLPFIGWMMRLALDIPVERGRRAQSADTLRKAARTLKAGCSVMVFPEGTRSPDGGVAAFSDGAFHLAVRAGVPILPIAVDGSGGWLPRGAWCFGPPPDIRVRVFPAVETSGVARGETDILREHVRKTIADQVASWHTPDEGAL